MTQDPAEGTISQCHGEVPPATRAMTTSARIHARNLLANWISLGLTLVVFFFLSPFVVHTLGKVEYGIWSLLNVLTGYMGILDLGVRASTGRHIFLYLGRQDEEAVDQTIRTSLGFFSAIGLLIFAVGGLLGWVFPNIFSTIPDNYRLLAMLLVPLMAFNVWLTALTAVFSNVLAAHERFDLTRAVDVLTLAVQATGTVFVLYRGYGIVGLALVTIGCHVLPLVCNWYLAKRIYRPLRIWPLRFDRLRLRELLGYGLAAFVSSASLKVIGQTDLVVVGIALDVSAVTVYSIGAMLAYYSQGFFAQIGHTFFPTLQKAVARGEMGVARWLYFRQVRLAMLIGVPMYVGFILYAEPFIRLWMLGHGIDESAVQAAARVLQILSASKLLFLFTLGAGPILAAMNGIRISAALSIAEAIVNLTLSLVFVLKFNMGIAGVALGTLVARLLVSTFLHPWFACRYANIRWTSHLIRVGGTGLVATALFAVWAAVALHLVPPHSWPTFAASVALALAGYGPIAIFLIPKDIRTRILGRLGLATAQNA